jgi:hypothetical protein
MPGYPSQPISNGWLILFQTFRPEPLLPRLMVANVDRYLWDSSRDFFYLTSTVEGER